MSCQRIGRSDAGPNSEIRSRLDHRSRRREPVRQASGRRSAAHGAACLNPEKAELGKLISTGLPGLDTRYGGLRAGGLYVIAARPGNGKSALAKQIANHCDLRGRPSLFVSLEMETHEIASRVMSERTQINGRRFEVDEFGQCLLQPQELRSVNRVVAACEHSVLWIDAPRGPRATIEGIAATVRLHRARYGIELVVIDYLQLVAKSHRTQTDYDRATHASQMAKQIARDNGIAVIALAQLNRESERSNRSPRLSDLRDSGAIEQDADGVMFLDPIGSGNAFHLMVSKWRNEAIGDIPLRFNGALTRFEEPEPEPEPEHHTEFAEFAHEF